MDTPIKIAGIVKESIVDGPGIRLTVYTQGCPHRCPGCHNPETHDFDGGTTISIGEIIELVKGNPLLDGVTFSGGEPFVQAKPLVILGRKIKKTGLNIMTYTGYTYETLIKDTNSTNGWQDLLAITDILVDGRFEIEKRNILLPFRGSENQRIIDMNKTRKQGEITLFLNT